MKRIYNTITQTFLTGYPRVDDEPIVGLDPSLEVYEVIEAPKPAIETNQYLTPKEILDHNTKTLTHGWDINEYPTPAVIVSFRNLAFTLLEAGLYEQVKTAALATPEGEIWWNTAQSTVVERDHPFVNTLGTSIGQTPEQLDAIFAIAASV
jgi:hypothetical protein